MKTMAHNLLRSRAYVNARALGMSMRRAAIAAGYHPNGCHRVEQRLKAKIELRKRQMAGYAKHLAKVSPTRLSRNDTVDLVHLALSCDDGEEAAD